MTDLWSVFKIHVFLLIFFEVAMLKAVYANSELDFNNQIIVSNTAPYNPKAQGNGFVGEDEDGAYYFETTSDDGSKEVEEVPEHKPSKAAEDNGLRSVLSDGSYLYKVELAEHHNGASLRIGQISPPQIKAALDNGTELTFEKMYSSKPLTAFLFDYSWEKEKWGVWGFTIGTGFAQTTGQGRFKKDIEKEAHEKYTFYLVPNHISLIYKFQYRRRPWVVPYISGGYCPMGLLEVRDDGGSRRAVSAHAVSAAGGIKLSISALDPESAYNLDAEYGIGNVWLDLEARIFKGLQSQRDVSSNVLNAGVGFDF